MTESISDAAAAEIVKGVLDEEENENNSVASGGGSDNEDNSVADSDDFIVSDEEDDDGTQKKKSKKSKDGKKDKKKSKKEKKKDKKKRDRERELEEEEEEAAKGGKRKKKKGFNIFLDEADEGDDDEEEYEVDEKLGREANEILDKDAEAAIAAVERRHQQNKEFLARSADEVAADYIKRHKVEAKMKQKFENKDGFMGGASRDDAVAQQSLLPSIRDPPIFKVKCKTGMEVQLVRSIMLKALDPTKNGGVLKIKTAFCNNTKGVVYVEALNELFVKETINGLRGIYVTSAAQIPVQEMTTVLNATVKKKPLKVGQWVRIKRGVLKGDLARIINLFEGGAKAFIQAVPRPDYSDMVAVANGGDPRAKKSSLDSSLRPIARLFDPAEVLKELPNAYIARNSHPLDPTNTLYDIWNNDFYRHGFLYKDVNVNTYISADDVRPKLEELMLFRGSAQHKSSRARTADDEDYGYANSDEDDEEEEDGGKASTGANFIKELAAQIKNLGEEEEKDQVSPFVPGDMVMVVGGEMQNLVARIVAVNDATKIASIRAINQHLLVGSDTTEIELELLVKYIEPGCHVKVVAGSCTGQTGRVVSVNKVNDSYVAAILTDGVNSEIIVSVGHIQMSNEVSIGQGSLMGYELYDLVGLHDNDNAVVIQVGAEKLTVINQTDAVEVVYPLSLQGKRNVLSTRSQGFDFEQNTIKCGDTVNVVSGKHNKLNGTIKHMLKGILWLHSKSYLKNSGIFVVRARHVVVSGGKSITPSLSNNYGGVLSTTPVGGPNGGASVGGNSTGGSAGGPKHSFPSGRFGKDAAIGKTVKITKGKYKGMLAQVVDVTPTHYNVEILAKLVKAVIDRNHTVPVGDRDGSFVAKANNGNSNYARSGAGAATGGGAYGVQMAPNTPYLTSQTPLASMGATPAYSGSATPGYYGDGNATPSGAQTPLRPEDSYFKISAQDKKTAAAGLTSSSSSSSATVGPYGSSSVSGGSAGSFMPNPSPAFTDTYSPAQSSVFTPHMGGDTPMSGMSGAGGNSSVSFREWAENFVVRLLEGQYQGRFAVLQTRADESGMFQVSLRDGSGKVESRAFAVHYSELALAEAPKKETVYVLTGDHKGQRGIIKVVQNRDAFVQLSETTAMLKIYNLAWINHDSGK